MSPGNAEVSLDEIYRLMLEMREDLIALKAANVAKTVEDHETRIRALERLVWKAAGAAAAVGALLGVALQFLF